MTRKAIMTVVVATIVAGSIALTAYSAVSPGGRCLSCHNEESFVVATDASAHGTAQCLDCHTSGDTLGRATFRLQHLPSLLGFGGGVSSRDLSAVSDARCLACHERVYTELVSANGVRVDHAECTSGLSCTECHSTTAHGSAVSWVRTYDMETCIECHVSEDLTDCTLCHDGRLPADRITTGVFAVTHGPQWEQTHGMGNPATCAACHTAADCATCHGPGLPHGYGFVSEHAEFSAAQDAQCRACHETTFCDGCHGLEMPHPQAFIAEHAGHAEESRSLCERCHVASDCTVCHEMHVHPGGAIGRQSGEGDSR